MLEFVNLCDKPLYSLWSKLKQGAWSGKISEIAKKYLAAYLFVIDLVKGPAVSMFLERFFTWKIEEIIGFLLLTYFLRMLVDQC